jgi:hypothetical protein
MNVSREKSWTIPAIVIAGLIAGILDITSAFVIAELKGMGSIRMLQGIASGLLGPPIIRRRNGDSWVGSRHSFPDRIYGGGRVLRGQSTIEFSNPARHCVGIALRNCGLRFHVLVGRAARVRSGAPFHFERLDRSDRSHGFDWTADCARGPSLFAQTIINEGSFGF